MNEETPEVKSFDEQTYDLLNDYGESLRKIRTKEEREEIIMKYGKK